MVARRTRCVPAARCQRIVWCRNRDQIDAVDLDVLDPRHVHIERSADADTGDTRTHQLGDRAERLYILYLLAQGGKIAVLRGYLDAPPVIAAFQPQTRGKSWPNVLLDNPPLTN